MSAVRSLSHADRRMHVYMQIIKLMQCAPATADEGRSLLSSGRGWKIIIQNAAARLHLVTHPQLPGAYTLALALRERLLRSETSTDGAPRGTYKLLTAHPRSETAHMYVEGTGGHSRTL